jgi:glutamate formiminotransferase/formiminotetrahydrofolate cyclodeaminase
MTQRIVECIPNFSEGQRLEVVDEIEGVISAVSGVHVLDRHSDADHNRSVITFAGSPSAVLEAAFSAVKTAAKLIDLETHQGEHPRIGATDVVPFVPLSGVTMDDCVEMAHQLGKRVSDELDIPVYFYERAAVRSDRVNLEDIRRGGYEKLKRAISADPDRAPDFGPARLGSAGATVIGARPPLIAFNVYLSTDDVTIAKKIARTVRYSSGGLRYVKALGMLVEGRAQVSMNLTDFTQTPIARVVEAIRHEAQRYEVDIHHSELVGLIPLAAVVDATQSYLQLDQFNPDQVLETRMFAATADEPTFLEKLAAGTPTPGGGSSAAYTGAMAAALVAMVARLTINKKKYADVRDRMLEIIDQADQLRSSLELAVNLDTQAFNAVMQALRMPKGSKAELAARDEMVERATHQATIVPLQVANHVVEVLRLAAEIVEKGNLNAITDAGSAGVMAKAALKAAGLNVRINIQNISDQDASAKWLNELNVLEEQAKEIEVRLSEMLWDRAELEM